MIRFIARDGTSVFIKPSGLSLQVFMQESYCGGSVKNYTLIGTMRMEDPGTFLARREDFIQKCLDEHRAALQEVGGA